MMIKKFINILSFLLCLTGCSFFEEDVQLEEALTLAGDNRSELEKVLAYYADDALKLDAAKFLIRNMPGHYSYEDTVAVIHYSNRVDTILTKMRGAPHQEIQDSINACAKEMGIPSLKKVPDVSVITSDYLIRNIDDAFEAWQEGPWARHLGFDDFCEYLLPYKVEELQLLDDWRFRLKGFHSENVRELEMCDILSNSPLAAARRLNQNLHDYMLPSHTGTLRYKTMKVETNAKVPFGPCDYYAYIASAVFRSQGIPVVRDFTPQWAFRSQGHHWNIIPSTSGKNIPFSGVCTAPGEGHKLDEKMPKAYRVTYAQNKDLRVLNGGEEYVPEVFRNIFMKDVTDEYIDCATVTLPVPRSYRYAYLAVFDDKNWKPVAYTGVRNGKACFEKMGKNIVYIAIGYERDGTQQILSEPFLLRFDGTVKNISGKGKKHERIILKRKYPVQEYVYQWLNRLETCEFQASNDVDFRDYYVVHRISDCHATGYEVVIPDSIPSCRFWRFMSMKPDTHANVSEIYLFDEKGKLRQDGMIIGTDGSWGDKADCTRNAAFDGDILSFFDAPDGEHSWVGMAFNEPVKMKTLFYYARGDGNAIEPYDTYELLYWNDGGWNSLGRKIPGKPWIEYDAPAEALLLLRDLTKGKDERIFTYENGRQVWW